MVNVGNAASTVSQGHTVAPTQPDAAEPADAEVLVETKPEEVEGFHIVRAIVRDLVSPKRVFMRDAQSYCAILFDDNNRKPICRLRFNNEQKLVLGLMNGKDEEKVGLSDLEGIYEHADKIRAAVSAYLAG